MTFEIALCLTVIVVMIILLALNKLPVCIGLFSAGLVFCLAGLIEWPDLWAGFSSNTIILLAGAMIIGDSLFKTGAATLFGRRIITKVENNEKKLLLIVTSMAGFLSGFVSNSATVAMFIPLVRSTCANSGGKLHAKHIIMPLGLATIIGGTCTLIGSTPQLMGQSILENMGLRTFTFFELSKVGLPVLIFTLIYFASSGYRKIIKIAEHIDDSETMAAGPSTDNGPTKITPHMMISIGCFIFLIVGFMTGLWTEGGVAMVAATICIISGCVTVKQAFEGISWSTLVSITGALGIGKALSNSGATELLAEGVKSILGSNPHPFAIVAALIITCSLIGNVISHTSGVAILAPIFIAYAKTIGVDPTFIVFCVVAGLNTACATPIVMGSYTMTLSEGYHFTDYFKFGWPVNLGSCIISTVVLCAVYAFQYGI